MEIKLTFVNYNENQTDNAGSQLSAKLIVQKEELVVIFHETCDESTLSCVIAKSYKGVQGTNNIYYHEGTLDNGINDRSYRYSGANPNNYVCFGSEDATCPSENLYRIIGIFNGQVKLIKATSSVSQSWDSKTSNTWSTSSMNKYLNETYLKSFTEEWSKKIVETTWKVGGNTEENIKNSTPAGVYQYEIVNPDNSNATAESAEYKSKVALMYAHDYGFAAESSKWGTTLTNYGSVKSSNWLHTDYFEWIITRNSSMSTYAFNSNQSGQVNSNGVWFSNPIRPVFYLDTSVTFKSGDGKKDSPYRIEV